MQKYRQEYDMKLIGRNLRRLREARNLSVENVREYLQLGSVQAIYKYEAGYNFPRADVLLALLELYQSDYRELICKLLTECSFPESGYWVLFMTTDDHTERMLQVMIWQDPEFA